MIDYNKLQDDHWGNCTSNPEIGVTCAREHNSVCSGRASHDLGVCVQFLFQKKTPPNLAVSAVSATFLCHLNHLVWFEWQRDRFLMLWLLWLKIRNDLLCHNDLWRGVFGVTGVTTAMCHTHKGWVYPFPPQCKAQGQTVVTETLEPPSLKLEEETWTLGIEIRRITLSSKAERTMHRKTWPAHIDTRMKQNNVIDERWTVADVSIRPVSNESNEVMVLSGLL